VAELPSGTVTFLFSDIEGSTRLLQRLGDRWSDVVAAHNELMRAAFADAGGREVDRQGDAFFAVFPRARNALAAAATIQRELAVRDWPDAVQVLVRMGIHTGEPALGDEGYLGLDVVRAARICAIARGGQVLVSETTRALVRGNLDGLSLEDVGEHRLKDIDEAERLFQLTGPGLRDDLPVPAPVSPGADAVMAVAGRQVELANEALAAVRELELGPLAGLGPRIERQVQEALARRGLPAPPQAKAAPPQRGLPPSLSWAIFGVVVAGGFVALVVWLVSLVV
jgi:class 3 adenylate cyclase